MFEQSIVLRRAPLPRVELDALLARYREAADRYGPNSKRALKLRNEAIEVNMRLVAAIAKRYRLPVGWEPEDLLALGVPGLITAIERFDLSKGFAFSTYASWWVRHAINRALADTATVIRVPVHAQGSISREDRGDDTEPVTKWTDAARAARRICSLDAQRNTGDGDVRPFVDLMPAESVDPLDAIDAETNAAALRAALASLPEKERWVLEQRAEGLTLSEVGEKISRSRERVRQIEAEAHALLRLALRDLAPERPATTSERDAPERIVDPAALAALPARSRSVLEMRSSGATFSAIGRALDVSTQRAAQIAREAHQQLAEASKKLAS